MHKSAGIVILLSHYSAIIIWSPIFLYNYHHKLRKAVNMAYKTRARIYTEWSRRYGELEWKWVRSDIIPIQYSQELCQWRISAQIQRCEFKLTNKWSVNKVWSAVYTHRTSRYIVMPTIILRQLKSFPFIEVTSGTHPVGPVPSLRSTKPEQKHYRMKPPVPPALTPYLII